MRRYLVVWWVLWLSACVPMNIPASATLIPTPIDDFIDLTLAQVMVRLHHLSGWSLYQDTEHIILTEHVNPLTHEGELAGIVMHLWLANITPDTTVVNALNQILQTSNIARETLLSEPQAFIWEKHDSAYYLLNTDHHNMALVLAVRVPETDYLLAVNISTPRADYARMRQLLPALFTGFTVNDRPLNHGDLQHIPLDVSLPAPSNDAD